MSGLVRVPSSRGAVVLPRISQGMYDFAMLVSETHPLLSTKVKDKSQQPRKKPGKSSGGQEAKSPRTSKLSKLKGSCTSARFFSRNEALECRPRVL
ncbi:hypothetical protein HPB51_011299 [Rhipicephalus microplus]|uniref:Uncharacterized protein n=1 Tax=Rhipicephalus microplus TaxID=6941 RepID=A0A9J6DMH3_RHIMP|nr:hypothetical protein HPB51_011299 [Rhipicephalus microplus]